MNNPLSYTDPTGFFFSKLFKSIGRAIGNFFKAVGRVLKKALQNPIIRGIIQIVGCAVTTVAGCAAISAGLALAAGGSVVDALTAAAFSFAQIHIWDQVGIFVSQTIGAISNVGAALAKGIVHGVVGGALSVAQGGSFLQGFAASGIAGFAGGFSNIISGGDIALDTAIVAAAGCAGAVLSGGKCANGAVTAAFANLYNKFRWQSFAVNALRKIPGGDKAYRFVDKGFKNLNAAIQRGVDKVYYWATTPSNLPFKDGEIIFREVRTGKDIIEYMAKISFRGRTLHLEDIAIFPQGASQANIGIRGVNAVKNFAMNEARALGFRSLRVTGTRISGRSVGRVIDRTFPLK